MFPGDYLYVYGDMDEDGFYHGQLMNGDNGLVPSNFIERVMDDGGMYMYIAADHVHTIHTTFMYGGHHISFLPNLSSQQMVLPSLQGRA